MIDTGRTRFLALHTGLSVNCQAQCKTLHFRYQPDLFYRSTTNAKISKTANAKQKMQKRKTVNAKQSNSDINQFHLFISPNPTAFTSCHQSTNLPVKGSFEFPRNDDQSSISYFHLIAVEDAGESLLVGSQKGDIYSFSIITHEVRET